MKLVDRVGLESPPSNFGFWQRKDETNLNGLERRSIYGKRREKARATEPDKEHKDSRPSSVRLSSLG